MNYNNLDAMKKRLGFVDAFDLEGNEVSETIRDRNYDALEAVLDEAYKQAAFGKGKDRHVTAPEAFEKQQIVEIGQRLRGHVAGGPLFQAVKKIYESGKLPSDAAKAELLGAINYVAAAIIMLDSDK